jgi:hypothetical protein
MNNTYPINTLVRLSVTFLDSGAGNPIDPTSVYLFVLPSGLGAVQQRFTSSTGIVRDDVGKYHYNITPNVVGSWVYKWQGVGAATATSLDTRFNVEVTQIRFPP